jgi:anti-sigma factor RsiW
MAWLRTGIVCRKAADQVTDYPEDALPPRDRSRLEAPLADCPHCTEYLRQIQITISAAGQAARTRCHPAPATSLPPRPALEIQPAPAELAELGPASR